MDKGNFPKISIVTPSFNQGEFLEDTIVSILSQDYPNLEYIIIDGGSKDGSIDIIKKYSDRLAYWVSETDNGRGDALNKGFSRSTGEIMAWLGCGDMFFPWSFSVASEIFNTLPEVEWITSALQMGWNSRRQPNVVGFYRGYSGQAFVAGCYLPAVRTIQQEATFWRRSLWQRAGGYIDEKLRFVPDYELWARFWKYAQLHATSIPLGGIRKHPSQEALTQKDLAVAKEIWQRHYGSAQRGFWRSVEIRLLPYRLLLSYL